MNNKTNNKKAPNRELNISIGVNEDDEIVYQELNSITEIKERTDFDRVAFMDTHNFKVIPYNNGTLGIYNRELEDYILGGHAFGTWAEAVDALMDMEEDIHIESHVDLTVFKF